MSKKKGRSQPKLNHQHGWERSTNCHLDQKRELWNRMPTSNNMVVLTNESHPLRRSLEDQAKRGKLEPRQLLGCHVQNLLLYEGVVSQQFLPKLLKDLVDENHLEKLRPTKPKDRFMPSGKDMGPIGKNHSYSFSNHYVHKDNRNRRLTNSMLPSLSPHYKQQGAT